MIALSGSHQIAAGYNDQGKCVFLKDLDNSLTILVSEKGNWGKTNDKQQSEV